MNGIDTGTTALVIDPFDSNHWLYGTGETIYGGHDLLQWDAKHNVSIASLADGIEETAVLGLISPPGGPPLVSAIGDVNGAQPLRLQIYSLLTMVHGCRFRAQLSDYASRKQAQKPLLGDCFGHRLRREQPKLHRSRWNRRCIVTTNCCLL